MMKGKTISLIFQPCNKRFMCSYKFIFSFFTAADTRLIVLLPQTGSISIGDTHFHSLRRSSTALFPLIYPVLGTQSWVANYNVSVVTAHRYVSFFPTPRYRVFILVLRFRFSVPLLFSSHFLPSQFPLFHHFPKINSKKYITNLLFSRHKALSRCFFTSKHQII